ncbi:helix-turn-helix domain-containing protein [Pseudonocardia sp. C8]|uniref:PucR family transcriptional regulator n=1 Tax=Pseudonocardia sp. C8 TaxID=2762759 RepID=UPI001642A379|nr:PucR family transcriptional regulator [Pseudonocardia sp. C8]MBC3190914.1 helix-turn-helix domain-containing protein [Pseudonocardia sp. C8]
MLPDVHRHPVAAATLRRLELASARLAAECLAEMERRRPWFAALPADQRAGVALVTQTGVANFVEWLREPERTTPMTAEAFRIAPRDLARRISLRQTVELVRIAADVFEEYLPPLAADPDERHELTEAVLRFGREVAFAAATVYAGAAESRGAWDARLEALVVDAVLRGDVDEALVSRAAALGWDPAAPVQCLVGTVPGSGPDSPQLIVELRRLAARLGYEVLVGVQGRRLVVLLHATGRTPRRRVDRLADGAEPGGAGPPGTDRDRSGAQEAPADTAGDDGASPAVLAEVAARFGPGPVVAGPRSTDLAAAGGAVAEALAGLAAAPGHPDAPRPVDAADLLPERALCGDPAARRRLAEDVLAPLHDAGGELLRTLSAYLEGGASLEGCARTLYVHPNTVRYRLRRIGELVGRSPTDPREAFVLRAAVVADRVERARTGLPPDTPLTPLDGTGDQDHTGPQAPVAAGGTGG